MRYVSFGGLPLVFVPLVLAQEHVGGEEVTAGKEVVEAEGRAHLHIFVEAKSAQTRVDLVGVLVKEELI